MHFSTLAEWLAWQETLHPVGIDLGLERVAAVWRRLHPGPLPFTVITVGGTNGKGSTVALLESLYRAGGYRVGAYTSPHLLRYNERIRIDGVEIDDAALCESFERIDQARGTTSLTYFEFGTLAALDCFINSGIELAILEVGLGGRLDAVNMVDADVSIVTSIGIDHTAWLGSDREAIGFEKAGIFRAGRPAICGDPEPPRSLIGHAESIGGQLLHFGRDFGYRHEEGESWQWWGEGNILEGLPRPGLSGEIQRRNASVALMAVKQLAGRHPLEREAIERGVAGATLAGRFQRLPGEVERVLDVAHNPHAARTLATTLRVEPVTGRTLAVVGMLDDKDVAGVVTELQGVVDRWYVAGIEQPRGLPAEVLAARIAAVTGIEPARFASPLEAWRAAERDAVAGDRLLGFGSFVTVAELMARAL